MPWLIQLVNQGSMWGGAKPSPTGCALKAGARKLSHYLRHSLARKVRKIQHLGWHPESAPSRAERQTGGLVDREGGTRVIFDIDGTRERPRRVCFPFRLDHAYWDTGCRGRSSWSLDA